MPLMDEFREEREALKHGTPKEKLSYFWCYYKWHTIIIIGVVFFVVSMAYQILTRKDMAFYAAMVNVVELDGAATYNQSFAEYAGIDPETYDMLFDTGLHISGDTLDEATMTSREKLMVYIASQEIDVMVSDEITMEQYANSNTFMDLRDLLTQEQIAKYEPYFYYIDQAVVDEKNAQQDALNYEYVPEYPDPGNPDAMENPIPVGICLDEAEALKENYYFTGENVVLSVILNTKRPETASKYIDFLLQ